MDKEPIDMDYRNAFITGASSGLGRGLAAWFAHRGTRVFAAARRIDELNALKAEMIGGNIEPVQLDVVDTGKTVQVIQKLDEQCGGFDLVIANAGVGEETNGKRLKWEAVERVLQVNVMGAAATVSAALPKMVERKRGHVVGVSSIAAFRGMPRTGAYSGSKAFLAIFLESLRGDLGGTGVHVTSIHPGFVRTPMTARNKFKMPFLVELEDAVEKTGKAIVRTDPVFVFPWQMALAGRSMKALPPAIYDAVMRKARG